MIRKNILSTLVLSTVTLTLVQCSYVRLFDQMKCSYGDRGSLTATCVNATPTYFKTTSYRFDQLDETLRCLNCNLETLESNTFDISGNQIKNLDLRNSSIKSIKAKAFIGLIFMEDLMLSNNEISSIYPGTFTGVKKIRIVHLDNNRINSLSEFGFSELINLEKLYLQNNIITFIANTSFVGLNKLRELDLSYNQITYADVFDVNLTSLQYLNLRNNHINSLKGSDFYNLTSLKFLDLSYNKIRIPSVEINIEKESNLLYLDLSHNNIDKMIPEAFRGLEKLETLDLSYNNIYELPQKTLQNLYNLLNLNMSYNKLTKFQTGLFSGLPQLRELNFSHNSIEDAEVTGIFSLHSLHTLDFSFNKINDLDYVSLVSRLPRLSYLVLQNNMLPCELEQDMDTFFAEDNFKYILYGNEVGEVKCSNTPLTKKTYKHVTDSLVSQSTYSRGSRAAEIWLFVIISFVIVLIGVLFYLQYRTYQVLRYSFTPNRTVSRVNLVSAEQESRDNDFLKE